MSKFNIELLLKIVSAVIKAVIGVLFGVQDDVESENLNGHA